MIGSVSKQLTAAAVLLLEADGALSLSDSINRHLEGVPSTRSGIRLEHLLAHTSGLKRNHAWERSDVERDAFVRGSLEEPLLFDPGSNQRYSNVGFSLLAAVVERASGMSFEEFVVSRLFEPAGIERAGFHGDERWRADGRRARSLDVLSAGHRWRPDDAWQNGDLAHYPKAWFLRGAGSVVMDVRGLARWTEVMFSGGLLSEPARRRVRDIPLGQWRDPNHGYDFGIIRRRLEGGSDVYRHGGRYRQYVAEAAWYEPQQVALAMLGNGAEREGVPVEGLMRILRKEVEHLLVGEAEPSVRLPEVASLSLKQLQEWEGEYWTEAGAYFLVEVVAPAGGLRLVAADDAARALLSSGEPLDVTRAKVVGARSNSFLGHLAAGALAEGARAAGWPAPRGPRALVRLKEHWRGLERKHGSFAGIEALRIARAGKAFLARALVRFERGAVGYRTTWSDSGALQSAAVERDLSTFNETSWRFLPLSDRAFLHLDPLQGKHPLLEFRFDGGGAFSLVFGEKTIEARRT